MKRILPFITLIALTACGGQQSAQDKQIAENQKKIEILKQEAEIQRLQQEAAQNAPAAASQVYQLAASAVAQTIPQNLQEQAKSTGKAVTGTDGQQYMYDPDSGNWLLYGALGAAAGYLMANAMNNKNAAKYQPVSKPTAAVERVYKDYQAKHPSQTPAPRAAAPTQSPSNNKPFVSAATPQNQTSPNPTNTTNAAPNQAKPTPNYRPVAPSQNRSSGFGFGAKAKRGR